VNTDESLRSISSEECLAGLAWDGVEVKSQRLVATDSTDLVLLALPTADRRSWSWSSAAGLCRRRRWIHRCVTVVGGRAVAGGAVGGPAPAAAPIHCHGVRVQFDVHHVGGWRTAGWHHRLSVVVVAAGIATQTYSYSCTPANKCMVDNTISPRLPPGAAT